MNAYLRQFICLLLLSSSLICVTLGLTVGDNVRPGQFPSVVFVRGHNKSCAGVILNEHWVGTTAQCVYDQPPSKVMVLAGTNRINETSGVTFNVSKIEAHYKFTEETFFVHDIAAVKIDGAFEFGDLIQPIYKLYSPEYYDLANAAGWTDSGALYYAKVLMVEEGTCTQLLNKEEVYYPRGPGQFCTARSSSPGFLTASSGPLFINDDFLIGFYSYSVSSGEYYRMININTKVDYYQFWINYTISH